MPKSRRDRAIAFTKTTKKQGLEPKEKTIETVRSLVDQYERIFVYSLDNSRNNHLKDLRAEFKLDSRLIIFFDCPKKYNYSDFIRERTN